MGFGLLVFELLGALFIASFILWSYGNVPKATPAVLLGTFLKIMTFLTSTFNIIQSLKTYQAVLIAWYFSLCIVTILPNDISATFYRQCEADHNFIPPTTTLAPNSTNITETPVLQQLQGNISKYRHDD